MRLSTPYWTTRNFSNDVFAEMDRIFSEPVARMSQPAFEVTEADDYYLLQVDLPGTKKEDIQLELKDAVLSIAAERKCDRTETAHDRVVRMSLGKKSFRHSFAVPKSVESEKIEAQYENGVLELYLPKLQAAKPRQIEIQNSKSGFFDKLLGSKKSGELPS